MTDFTGRQLGDYRVLEPIGSGGMGTVYLAEHVHLRKQYALKVLPESLAHDQAFVGRFHDEARVMADLRHPHIVQVHHMGHAEGVYFLVMDYVTGPEGRPLSLHEYVRRQPEGRLAGDEARRWAIQIAEALAYAHARGVVHRDVKPANILVDPDGNVKLTDFGLAKAIGREFILSQIHQSMQASLSSRATRVAGKEGDAGDTLDGAPTVPAEPRSSGASSLLGTYDYMAPEQRGEGSGQIDQRSDIYSFGVLVYRLLTGKRPVGFARPPSRMVPGLSKRWDAVTARCLAESQEARYQSAEQLLEDLRRTGRGRRWPLLAAALVLLAAVGGAVYLHGPDLAKMAEDWYSGEHEPQVQPEGISPVEVTPSDAVKAKVAAELEWERVQALDRGQGIGKKLVDADVVWRAAGTYLESVKDYRTAKAKYDELLAVCKTIEMADGERTLAIAARREAESASKAAQDARAQEDAKVQWDTAGQAAASALGVFEDGRFGDARKLWTDAKDGYAKAVDQAKLVAEHRAVAEAAKENAAMARGEAQLKDAGKLAQALWEGAERETSGAQVAFEGGEFDKAKAAWESAADGYKKAGDYAQGVKNADAERGNYDQTLASCDRAKLERYAAEAWAKVEAAVQSADAARAEKDSAKAAAGYAEARRLLTEAQPIAVQAEGKESYHKAIAAAKKALAEGDISTAERETMTARDLVSDGAELRPLTESILNAKKAEADKGQKARYDKAIDAAEKALAAKEFDKAAQEAKAAGSILPSDPKAQALAKAIAEAKDAADKEARKEDYKRTLDQAREALGKGELDEAARLVETARAAYPESTECQAVAEAIANARAASKQKAKESQREKAIAAAKESLAKGDWLGASLDLTPALDLFPDDPEVVSVQEQISMASADSAKHAREAKASRRWRTDDGRVVTGKIDSQKEPTTGRVFHLYLPSTYSSERAYPLVLTAFEARLFSSRTSERDGWVNCAEGYGLIVCAVECDAATAWLGVPKDRPAPELVYDDKAAMAIVRELKSRYNINPDAIMITGFGGGAYPAHYIGMQHPDLFRCIVGRCGNFKEGLVSDDVALRARHMLVYVFFGEGDLAGLDTQNRDANFWYTVRGFRNFVIRRLPGGHGPNQTEAARYFLNVVNHWPATHIDASATAGTAPLTVTLRAFVRDPDRPDGRVDSVLWNLGDNTVAAQAEVTHAYTRPGLYNVFLTVVDTDGHYEYAQTWIRVE